MTVVPNALYFPPFSRAKIKLKGHNFDMNEVIESESQAVLNIFTEHDFPDTLVEALGTVHTRGRKLLRG
jgi:hypothetical protein